MNKICDCWVQTTQKCEQSRATYCQHCNHFPSHHRVGREVQPCTDDISIKVKKKIEEQSVIAVNSCEEIINFTETCDLNHTKGIKKCLSPCSGKMTAA